MHPLIGNLCARPDGGVDHALFLALQTTLSLDDALDLEEIDQVSRSHRDAAQANLERPTAETGQTPRGRRKGRR